MGKPLSRPDCLRQNPTCLGKGEEEDGYIEDCYVPQRSIYDTMRINEQIDQGSKLNQPSKSTIDKMEAGTISSNGTIGAANVFESRAPDSKKLDERVIFDALKLSSDVTKSAPAPPRRRPNPERKENVNRRSWKSFMPPNFPEFAERVEASLSEVSEAGASTSSLQEKRESSAGLGESSGQARDGEAMSEALTLEHVPKSSGLPEAQEARPLSEDGYDCFQDECQPLLKPEDAPARSVVLPRDRKPSSATWPRARRNIIKGSLSSGHRDALEAALADCTVETVPLSPCLSEELLDPGMNILITPSLREKTESELRFEEDERWIMMEAEEEWEAEMLSEGGKTVLLTDEKRNCCLADISEEREQLIATAVPTETADCSAGVLGTSHHPAPRPVHCDDSQLHDSSLASVPQETYQDPNGTFAANVCDTEAVTVQYEPEDLAPNSVRGDSPLVPEQFSDTDSVQMFLELEKQCLREEGDGAAPLDLEGQVSEGCSEGLDPPADSEQLAAAATEACQQAAPSDVSAADSAIVSDLEDLDGTCGSQVASTIEPTTEPYSEKETSSVTQTDSKEIGLSSPRGAWETISPQLRWPASQLEEAKELESDLLTDRDTTGGCAAGGTLGGEATVSPVADTVEMPCWEGRFPSGEDTGSMSPSHMLHCPPFGSATTEALDSQLGFYWPKDAVAAEGARGSEESECAQPERAEFSSWGVAELASEDEVTDLDKESDRSEGRIHGAASSDPHGFSEAAFPSDSVSELDSEAQVKSTESLEDLKSEEAVPLDELLPLDGIMRGGAFLGLHGLQEGVPGTVGRVRLEGSTGEADVWGQGDLARLFEHSWDDGSIQFVPGDTPSPDSLEHVDAEGCASVATTAEEALLAIAAPLSIEQPTATVLASTEIFLNALPAVGEPAAAAAQPDIDTPPVADATPPDIDTPPVADATPPATEESATVAAPPDTDVTPLAMEESATVAAPPDTDVTPLAMEESAAAPPASEEPAAVAAPPASEEPAAVAAPPASEEPATVAAPPATEEPATVAAPPATEEPAAVAAPPNDDAVPLATEESAAAPPDAAVAAPPATEEPAAEAASPDDAVPPATEEPAAYAVPSAADAVPPAMEEPDTAPPVTEAPDAATPADDTTPPAMEEPAADAASPVTNAAPPATEEPAADAPPPAANATPPATEKPASCIAPPAMKEPVSAPLGPGQQAPIAPASSVVELPRDMLGTEEFPAHTPSSPGESKVAAVPSTKAQAGTEELAPALPCGPEEPAAKSPGLEEPLASGQAPGGSRAPEPSTQMLPAAGLGMEEPPPLPTLQAKELSSAASGGKVLATTVTGPDGPAISALAAEGPPARTDGLVPDNEMFQKEQVDPIQVKLQQVNGVGQGLIQSAGKNCDVQGLEHDMEALNTRWNTLNKKVAQRIAQLQEALLHCGKFQDALEPLLSWLADTEELISNQKPPSAEYKVVKAQIQEQKLLQRLLDDRKATVEMIQAEGGRIAQSAEPTDREKIVCQLESLENRWAGLLGKAAARQKQLEDILVLAKQFHETTEPISDWLSSTEKKLANSEPIGTQTAKIQQQIARHKALEEDIEGHARAVTQAVSVGQSLSSLSCLAEQGLLAEKLDWLQARYCEIQDRCSRKAALLAQALCNARLFGENEVEVLNWLAEVEDKLSSVSVKDYKRDVLQKQHADQLALNEEIVNRKKNVDQAIKNGQALLKQTTGEEVLLIQEKLDGIKTRYSDITATSSKALRTLEQARQLATKFQSTHEELTSWMSEVEEELMSSGGQSPVGEQIPQFQQRQKELNKEVMEHRLVLDTVNEVSRALLELVPWRAREGLDKLVSDTNEQYKAVSDTVRQRVEEIDAAIQRSQQYEQAADAELAWVAETKRKLMALGPIRLEQDQTTAQLQVQKAFSIDIIRHKDSMDELFSQRGEIFGTCGEEQKAMLQEKTDSLVQQYEAVSQLHSERYTCLERAQVLVSQFWETHEELSPWIEETHALIAQLPPPAIDHEQLKQQQEDMRQLRESIAEHKPHIDKLLKIGPQLKELNAEEGAMVEEKYLTAEALYARIKEEVRRRALGLDEAVSQSTQFHDKIEPMLEMLESLSSRLRMPPSIPAEVDKIRECISENKNSTMELEKLQPSFEGLKRRGEELIGRSQGADKDPAAKEIQDKLDQMVFFWEDIKARAEERETKFLDVLELAEKFWLDMGALLSTVKDTQDIVHDLESPGIDPSIIKQQVEAAETIKEETDGLHEELEFIRGLGFDLIMACGETDKPEVKKSIDEMDNAWENLNKTWKERLEKLEEAMQSAVQYQDTLQAMFDWLDNTVIKLCSMPLVGTDLDTVKEQLGEMKEFKMEVYQQQIEMEKLNHQGELMLKKATDETDRDIIREPLTELKHLWENLGEKIAHRQHKLEAALLALGQFQHALAELMAWLTHTEELLDAQKPINEDPKVIEVELAKHHVLKNDVLAHQATVETVNQAGNELLESSAGDDASSLRHRLEKLNSCWESVLQKTEEREQQLQSTLQQAQGFHGEIEDFLLWLTRMESQLSASKPTGGLPETAREQLNAHMELYAQLKANEEVYSQLLAKGRLILLSRDDSGSGSKTEQSIALLEQKWSLVSTKMEERKSKLEEALSLATEFQNSLQDFINWLTLAEQSLNIAPPPSLILTTVLAQIDEHKVFANEVNDHRDQIIELDQTGNQLKFLSQKQDVVLIKNLLVSVQSRWEKVVQRSVDRGRALDDARKRAKQFHEAWRKLVDWLEDAENHLDSELEISNDPDKIKLQLSKHKEFQKTLGAKQPVYDTTIRTGRALKEKALLPDDTQKLDNLFGEVRDKWDTVCGKSVERQHKLEEALLFSGQFMDALQALVDWLYKVEPQLAEDQPVHGDLDLVMNLMDAHKVFQKELGKRTGTVQVLKRSGRELIENSRDDTTWVKVQLQELSNRWDTVCKLSVSKQTRLEQALKQAEEFRAAVHMLLEWLSEAEQTLRFRGALPDDAEALQSLIDVHKEFMKKVEEKRADVNAAVGMGEVILAECHPDCITTIKHWITIIRARFEEVLTWAKQHQQRLETALSELVANAELLEELLSWIQWAETTLIQRDQEPMPQYIDQVKALISEHQSFMEEMTRKQPDVDWVTKTYKRKATEPAHGTFMEKSRSNRKSLSQTALPAMPVFSQSEAKNPRINQLSARWQQVWLRALERQRKLNDTLDRLEELKEFANFDFDIWRKKYMRWMNHKKSRVMDFFRRIDKDQDGKITRQEFIDGILASKFPTTKLEMTAVADIFDQDGDGYIDYYEFVAALHPSKDAYRPTTDADKIEDEVTRQVAQCKCAKRFQVEQIGENKYRFFLGNQFGDSQQLRLVRILRSTVMVRVGGGWMALDEFLVKNDPCRARGRTNLELREKFILPEGASQGMTPFRLRGRRSKPSSRAASPTRSSSSASQSNHSCASVPSSPATPASGAKTPHHFSRCYDKPWLVNSKAVTPHRGLDNSDAHLPSTEVTPSTGSKLKRPTFHSSRTSLAGDTSNSSSPVSTGAKTNRADPKKTASRPTSRAGSRAGSRASSRRGSDASDFDLLETQSACSDTSESSTAGGQGGARRGLAKPSKIPTISKKTTTAPPKTPGPKR